MAVDPKQLAANILSGVGGESNVVSAAHCATRLRLKLNDAAAADKASVEALEGVVTVVEAGGQFQVVIGDTVADVYQELIRATNLDGASAPADAAKGNLLSRFIDLISGVIHPVLWTLAGAGLFKAFLAMAATFGWLSDTGTTYQILQAASDALFYFLPLVLGVSAAKHFKANQYTSMAIAGALVYPTVVSWSNIEAGVETVHYFGIPVVVANYTSSLVPIIVAVWLQGHLERFLARVLPATIRNFTIPLVVLFVMAPLTMLTFGPATTYAANALSSGIGYLFETAPWAGGAIMGGLWQVFVMFGLHWALVPVMLNDLNTVGHTLLGGPVLPAVLAQGAATLAVMLRTRSRRLRQIAGPAALSGLLSGITEPAIYGVNLPKKRPFLFGCIGGAAGGILAAVGGNANDSFVFPSLIALPAYMNVGSFAMQLIGCGVAMTIAFGLTFAVGFPDAPDTEAVTFDPGGDDAPGTPSVVAPVSGRVMPLEEVGDQAFASGAMGAGVGIAPSDGRVSAPISGQLVVAMDSGHAYGIASDDGVEVLVHIGIDTVELDGKHFTKLVTAGQRVKRGDQLATVDLDALRADGYDTTTLVIVTNTAALAGVEPQPVRDVEAGDTILAITRKDQS